MLSEGFAYPAILSIVGIDDNDEVIPSSIIRMKQVGYNAKETTSPCQHKELIISPQFLEYFLLILLGPFISSVTEDIFWTSILPGAMKVSRAGEDFVQPFCSAGTRQ
jgi:hypothetical protein